MKAIILAAGYSTRLANLTKYTPKPLLKINEKRLIEIIINKLEKIDEIDTIYIVTNDKFFNIYLFWKDDFESTKEIVIINDGSTANENRLGPLGDIYFGYKQEHIDDDLLIIAGDNLFDIELENMLTFINQKNSSCIGVYDLQDKSKLANKFGVVEIDENNKIIGFEEKPNNPKTSLTATFIYFFKQKDLIQMDNCIQEKGYLSEGGEFIKYLSENVNVYAYNINGNWYDIGTEEDYLNIKNNYNG